VSGNHYATANLYEPWGKVAEVVAQDARRGATIISVNPPFFLYLDYQLGLESDTKAAETAYLGEAIYRSHGYAILQPDDWQTWAGKLHGKVVLANGSGFSEQVEEQNALNDALHLRCKVLGDYRAAADPAALWKARFAKDAPILAYPHRRNLVRLPALIFQHSTKRTGLSITDFGVSNPHSLKIQGVCTRTEGEPA